MGGRGASSQSHKSGDSYGAMAKRSQSHQAISDGAHSAFSGMDKHNLRINLGRTSDSLANAGRNLSRSQKNKLALERDLAYAKQNGDSRSVRTLEGALRANERELQAQMVNIQNLKTVRNIAREYYAKFN